MPHFQLILSHAVYSKNKITVYANTRHYYNINLIRYYLLIFFIENFNKYTIVSTFHKKSTGDIYYVYDESQRTKQQNHVKSDAWSWPWLAEHYIFLMYGILNSR